MQPARAYVFGTALFIALGGAMLAFGPTVSSNAAERKGGPGEHWRYHDGRWNYWDTSDKRWYYTDGAHWYYNDKDTWHPYNFNAHYGRKGFERGEYRAPRKGAKIELPRHRIYVEPR